MVEQRFDVDATPDIGEIDRSVASERSSKMPSLNVAQWDNKKVIVGAALGGAVLFGLLSLISGWGSSNDLQAVKAPPPAAEAPYDPSAVIAPTLAGAATDAAAPIPLASDQVPAIGADGQPQPGQAMSEEEKRIQAARELQDSARRSTLVAYNGNGGGAGILPRGGAGDPDTAPAPEASDEATPLDNLKRTTSIGQASARMIGDRNYLVTAGAIIPCTLQTAMDSSVPGYTTCIIPRDIYSDNGRVVLLEKGTRVFGEYQGGLQRGQARLFAMWTRAVTPRGVAIDIASPASDPLGRAGITGKINRFFWQRFGAALLFSVLDAGGQIGGQALGPDGSTVLRTPGNTTSQILQDTQQIRPVVRVNQGTELAITVAKDFDFASVYGLGLK